MPSDKQEKVQETSTAAVESAAHAADAIEKARIAQMELSAEQQTKIMIKALESIFGESDNKDPEHMTVLVRRIPILCTNIDAMHASIEKIQDNITWAVRIVIGAVILGVIALLIKH